MSENKIIKNYTAADIERYHRGLLSAKERHDLERAALDDPFLAEALEGYAVTGVNITADIAELKRRLAERSEDKRTAVVPINKRFSFLKVAAAVVLMVGTAILVYQLMFRKHDQKEMAVVTNKETQQPKADSNVNSITTNIGSTTNTNEQSFKDTNKPAPATRREVAIADEKKIVKLAPENNNNLVAKGKEAPVVSGETRDMKTVAPVNIATIPAGRADDKKQLEKDAVADADELKYRNQKMNTFRGKVTDNSNVGVPFANVTNVQDNMGTYTDANGNFTLVSSDSVLNVQVRSIGYENNNMQLRNDRSNNLKMQEDRNSLSEVVISTQKPNTAARSARKSNVTVTEPEPVDGWEKYDSYLANNIDVPDDFKPQEKLNNTVEVSFEVDKNGEPVNIKVEKSLCSSCDKEAVRLLKDGPKWKSNASRKGRTTVTIKF